MRDLLELDDPLGWVADQQGEGIGDIRDLMAMGAGPDRLHLLSDYRYYFQFTLNAYPALLEPGLPPLAARIEAFRALSMRLGPDRVVWRYDPVILSRPCPRNSTSKPSAAWRRLWPGWTMPATRNEYG